MGWRSGELTVYAFDILFQKLTLELHANLGGFISCVAV